MDKYTGEEIYKILHDEIINLTLKPGEIISEARMASRFNVSRTPIKAVFTELLHEKLINVYPQRGSVVSLIDLMYVKQIMYARRILEISITSDIINNITNTHLEKLKYNLVQQEAIINSGLPYEKFFELDNEFHKLLFNISGKDIVWQIIAQQENQYYRYRMLDMSEKEHLENLFAQHQKIYNYIFTKDISNLNLVISEHLNECFGTMEQLKNEYSDYFSQND